MPVKKKATKKPAKKLAKKKVAKKAVKKIAPKQKVIKVCEAKVVDKSALVCVEPASVVPVVVDDVACDGDSPAACDGGDDCHQGSSE